MWYKFYCSVVKTLNIANEYRYYNKYRYYHEYRYYLYTLI